MKFKVFLIGVFQFPFHRKRLANLICLSILTFSICAAASDDVHQVEDSKQLSKQAEKLVRKGEFAAAEKILRRVLAMNPQNSKAKLSLAYILFKQKRLLEAYELSFPVAKTEPENSYAFAVLGVTYLSAGNFKEAELLLNNALKLDRQEALAWAGLGMLNFYENRIDESIIYLRQAVYFDQKEPDFVFTLAQVSARAENYNEAAEAYRRFLSISPETDTERRDRIKGLISFLSFLGGRKSIYDLGGAKHTSVPLKLINDRPVVELRINNKSEPLKFVLDTGSGISVVSLKTAERLKIKPVTKGGVARAIGGDGKFDIVYGFLKSVEIGDVKIKSVPIYIREFHNKNEEIDGYIGLSLISKFLTTIDYGNLTFSLLKKDPARNENTGAEAVSLPLRITSSGFLSGVVELEGVKSPLNFIVDTGASISVISDEVAAMDGISRFGGEEKMRVFGAAGITDDVPLFLLPRVTFGSYSRERVRAIALDLDIINETTGFEQSGILGGNFLKNYRLIFDFQNSKVTFVPVDK